MKQSMGNTKRGFGRWFGTVLLTAVCLSAALPAQAMDDSKESVVVKDQASKPRGKGDRQEASL